jgi:hypothetical protein
MVMRDDFISLGTKVADVVSKAKKEYEREATLERCRPGAKAPPSKRAATSGGAATSADAAGGAGGSTRRVRALKAWNAAKQESRREAEDKMEYVSVEKLEVVTVVSSAEPWLEVVKADGSRGNVPMELSTGGPRFEDVEEAPAPVASSDDDESDGEERVEVFGGRDGDVGDEMTMDMAGGPRRATTPPPAPAEACLDNDLTPGRPGAPIIIDKSAIGEWFPHEHLQKALLIAGEHKGDTLWWDGALTYKLAGQPEGHVVRIRSA